MKRITSTLISLTALVGMLAAGPVMARGGSGSDSKIRHSTFESEAEHGNIVVKPHNSDDDLSAIAIDSSAEIETEHGAMIEKPHRSNDRATAESERETAKDIAESFRESVKHAAEAERESIQDTSEILREEAKHLNDDSSTSSISSDDLVVTSNMDLGARIAEIRQALMQAINDIIETLLNS